MSDKSFATGVALLHPVAEDQLQTWIKRVTEVVRSMPGFKSLRQCVSSGALQPALAVTFDTVEHLQAWLESDALGVPNAEGVLRKSADLLIVEGHRLPPGVAVFRHDVIEGQAADFVATQQELVASTARFPGYIGTVVVPPAPEADIDLWTSILLFRTDDQLAAWSGSDERIRRLTTLRSHLTRDFDTLSVDAPFGSILRIDHGRPRVTPKWKTAMLVLLVLYPTVMTLSRVLGPALKDLGAEPWLSTWLMQIVSVTALTYVLMPLATRLFGRWLDPIDGAAVRVSTLGALAAVAVYTATLWLFASVQCLDFWRH
jgi:antibiotic biosynthesis monooxygenase (ABM) superfamily enzyme